MKRLVSILLALFVLYNSGVYLFLYIHSEKVVKQEAKDRIRSGLLREDECKLFVVSKSYQLNENEFTFIGDDEILYQGQMYDIVKVEDSDDSIKYYCLNDESESKLLTGFTQLNKQVSDKEKSLIITVLSLVLAQGLLESTIDVNTPQKVTKIIPQNTHLIKNISADILDPPPKNS
ncbi:MAG: hypothetical protein ACP5P3_08825 [Ignavibacteria bacterium]